MTFTRALVRPPADSFADGLTTAGLGAPTLSRAREQHQRYCEALDRCGLTLIRLPDDDRFPDGTFVEDAAIVTREGAVLAHPGASSRRGEVDSVSTALVAAGIPVLGTIEPPGTLDGGDICDTGDRVLIGLSGRTNEEGAAQLRAILGRAGIDGTIVDLRATGLLHLKSGLAFIGRGRLLAVDRLAKLPELAPYAIVRVEDDEAYAANAVFINGRALLARGFPHVAGALAAAGDDVVTLEMSEFRKMDGGLSCLSIRL